MSGHGASGFFVLRAPRLPLAPVDDLRGSAGDPHVRDALAAASPELAAAVARGDAGVELSLTRYLARMSGRPTPRGLLAGVSVGRIGTPGTALRVGEPRASSRLSAAAAAVIAARVQADPALRPQLPYRANPTAYEAQLGQLRYVEPRGDGHALVAAQLSPELARTLARARGGATLADLAGALAADGADPDQARAFVDELVGAGLLLSDLNPAAHGGDPGRRLLEQLQAIAPGSAFQRDVEMLLDAMAAADRAAPGRRAEALAAAAPAAARLGFAGPVEQVVQVELMRPAPGLSLPGEVVQALLSAVEVLRRLMRSEEPEDLSRFREAFRRRYGGRRVPLLEALDPDAGVGFGRDAARPAPAPAGEVPWGASEQLMLRLVGEAAARGLGEVDLLAAVPSLADRPAAALPGSFALLASLSAESEAAIDRGDYEARLIGAFGPSGARLLGRFCDHDAELRAHVERHLSAEEALRPDAIFAEIAHLPAGAADVATRPALRAHEIALFAAPGAGRIEPGELDVGLEGDEIVLRLADGRRVIPRLTNAHDMLADGLGLYRFLAQLQFQGFAAGLSWQWGPLAGAPFLPRVRVDRVVLAPARWRIAPDERLALARGGPDDRAAAVAAWRRRTGCPRHVALVAGESALPLDLEDATCAEILLRDGPAGVAVVVEECWPPPGRSPVTGPGGRYAHELVIPVVLDRPPARDPRRPRPRHGARRTHPPGSEWLFAKLYAGSGRADALIVGELAPLARRAVATGAATEWHFVRFEDPDLHLRLRIGGDRTALRDMVLPALLDMGDRLIETGAAQRLTLDTYERELERYGGADAIALAEAAFHADSEAVADLLARIPPGEEAAAGRWRLAAAGTWSLLLALGLSADEAAAVAGRLRDELATGQRLDRTGVRGLARGLRAARPVIEQLLAAPPEPLGTRDAALAAIGEDLQRLARAGRLCRAPAEIAGALAHMHCNRLLRGAPQPQELRIHDAVVRLAAGRVARARRAGAPA